MSSQGRGGPWPDAWDVLESGKLSSETSPGYQRLGAPGAEALDGSQLSHRGALEELVNGSRGSNAQREFRGRARAAPHCCEEPSGEDPRWSAS